MPMIYLLIFFLIFPVQWERYVIGKNLKEKEEAIKVFRELETEPGIIGTLSIYNLSLIDENNSYFWFKKLLEKNPPKALIEDAYKNLVEKNFYEAMEDYEVLKKKFSLKFRKEIELKIYEKIFEKERDFKTLENLIKKNDFAFLNLSMKLIKENFKMPDSLKKKLFEIALKYRNFEVCKKLLEEGIFKENLRENENLMLGRFYFLIKDYKNSLNHYGKIKSIYSDFQKARIHLFLNEEEKAFEILKNINLDEAKALLLRLFLKNGEFKSAEEILNKIKSHKTKNNLKLNLSIHYNFYGKKEEALKILNSLRKTEEIKFWISRIKGEPEFDYTQSYAPFNYFYFKKNFKKIKNEEIKIKEFKPQNFVQFLIFKGFFKEALFFPQTIKFEDLEISKLYHIEKNYKKSIEKIYKEAIRVLKEDIRKWNPELLSLFFPKPYNDLVKRLSYEFKVPENLIYAIMRQESLFDEKAVSKEGALGIMQILPQNFYRFGEDLENPFDIEKNLKIALKYLKELKEIFGEWVYVISAYNAGEDAVLLWLKDPVTKDLPSFYSTIPYKETKFYTKNVLYNWLIYNIIYGVENENI